MNAQARILVVDDDRDLVRGLGVRLRAKGHDLLYANDGVQAVAIARRERPDLILLDIGLPGGDGYLVLERLQGLSGVSHVPVIVLSAKDPAVHREKALAAGAHAFLQKPVESPMLMATIQNTLGLRPSGGRDWNGSDRRAAA